MNFFSRFSKCDFSINIFFDFDFASYMLFQHALLFHFHVCKRFVLLYIKGNLAVDAKALINFRSAFSTSPCTKMWHFPPQQKHFAAFAFGFSYDMFIQHSFPVFHRVPTPRPAREEEDPLSLSLLRPQYRVQPLPRPQPPFQPQPSFQPQLLPPPRPIFHLSMDG